MINISTQLKNSLAANLANNKMQSGNMFSGFVSKYMPNADGLTNAERATMNYNSAEAQKGRDFQLSMQQMQNAYNSEEARKNREEGITAQIAQYRQNGLNPYAMLDSGFNASSNSASSSSVGSSESTVRATTNGTDILKDVGKILKTLVGALRK